MKTPFRLFISALVLASTMAAADLPQLFAKSETGLADAQLRIVEVERTADRSVIVTAAALAGAERVAIQVVIPPKWESSKGQPIPIALSSGTIRIKSVGRDTEAFVRALAKAYGVKVDRIDFTEVMLAAIMLRGDPSPIRMATSPTEFKVFFESKKEEEYAEAFINLNIQPGVVQFGEKDPDYRKAVIGFLSRPKG